MQVCEESRVGVSPESRVAGPSIEQREAGLPGPSPIVREAIERSAWGIAASIDIYDCDPATIRDADKIRQFVVELCDLIEMKRFQDTLVVNFGEDERVAGFSMVQLIETSLISAHFANMTNTTYLDVFSCKPYDPRVVEQFAMKFFRGSRCLTDAKLRL
jgi:S-adenosylmethionine/arginine decarboxylase-like enzyme